MSDQTEFRRVYGELIDARKAVAAAEDTLGKAKSDLSAALDDLWDVNDRMLKMIDPEPQP